MPKLSDRPYIFDASRLIWRLWRGRLPTGIDRVCLAYLEAFADRSQALIQWRNRRVVLTPKDSDRLFTLLLQGAAKKLSRKQLTTFLTHAMPTALALHYTRSAALKGKLYLNVGHTGLHIASLPRWLSRYGLRPVHLIHDLIPITHPQFCRTGERDKHSYRMRHALQDTSGIIVNSAETGKHLTRFAQAEGLPIPSMLVAPLGIETLSKSTGKSLHPRPYFLCIGTIEARKNHILLLHTWAKLRSQLGPQTPDLILVGQRGWEAEETFQLLDAPQHPDGYGQIIELADCSDNELAQWIDGARAALMPSHVEGYGLPVLETLSRGVPVIASDLPVYLEITQGIPRLLDANDVDAWAAAITDYLQDHGDRARQLAALEHYVAPSWDDHMALVQSWLANLPKA